MKPYSPKSFCRWGAAPSLCIFVMGWFTWEGFSAGKNHASLTESMLIVRVKDHKVLFEKQADNMLIPASVMKLVTGLALFYHYGAYATLVTKFYRTGPLNKGQLQGNLIIEGAGDPLLTSESLWKVAADLKGLGLKEITGDLVIDNRLFTDAPVNKAREEGAQASRHAYDAPVTAFAVNFNTITIALAPNESPGHPLLASVYPYPIPSVRILNHSLTLPTGRMGKPQLTRKTLANGQAELLVEGSMGIGQPLEKIYRSTPDPVRTGGELVKAFLQDRDILIRGEVREGIKTPNAAILLEWQSEPISKMVAALNLYSNNHVGDTLSKRLGADFGKEGSLEEGAFVLQRFLQGPMGLKAPFVIKDGSGLSADNRLSARCLITALLWASERIDFFPEFFSSLPLAGESGSLKKRFDKHKVQVLKGLVRGKTGTLSDPLLVSSLAGYFSHPEHGLVAFALLSNEKHGANAMTMEDLHSLQEERIASLFF